MAHTISLSSENKMMHIHEMFLFNAPKVLVRHALSLEKDSNMTKFGFPYSYGAEAPFNIISLSSVIKIFYGIMR